MTPLASRLRVVFLGLAALALVAGLFDYATRSTPTPSRTSTPASPAAVASAPAPVAPRVLPSPIGTWRGNATNADPDAEGPKTYPLTIEIGENYRDQLPTIDYPSIGCGGHLEFQQQTGDVLIFHETIDYGADRCAQNSTVRLALTGDVGTGEWFYWDATPFKSGQLACRVALARNAPAPPAPALPAPTVKRAPTDRPTPKTARPTRRTQPAEEEEQEPPPSPIRDGESYADYFQRLHREEQQRAHQAHATRADEDHDDQPTDVQPEPGSIPDLLRRMGERQRRNGPGD